MGSANGAAAGLRQSRAPGAGLPLCCLVLEVSLVLGAFSQRLVTYKKWRAGGPARKILHWERWHPYRPVDLLFFELAGRMEAGPVPTAAAWQREAVRSCVWWLEDTHGCGSQSRAPGAGLPLCCLVLEVSL